MNRRTTIIVAILSGALAHVIWFFLGAGAVVAFYSVPMVLLWFPWRARVKIYRNPESIFFPIFLGVGIIVEPFAILLNPNLVNHPAALENYLFLSALIPAATFVVLSPIIYGQLRGRKGKVFFRRLDPSTENDHSPTPKENPD